jgi:hypothetical protein
MSSNDRPTFTADDPVAAQGAVEEIMAAQGERASRDELSKKAEKLIAQANKLLEQIEVETADPAALNVENEVRKAMNELNEVYVSNSQSEYAYAWIFRDAYNQFGGRYVRKMQALGWEVVSGDMPEAIEHRHVDNTRVVADCLLMRIRLDRRLLLEKRDRLLREAQQAGVTARVYELAERAGTQVYDKLPGFVEEAINSQAAQRRVQRAGAMGAFHRLNQGGKVDRMLKTGTIPGVPPPGAGGR